jgi:hypothetical protein
MEATCTASQWSGAKGLDFHLFICNQDSIHTESGENKISCEPIGTMTNRTGQKKNPFLSGTVYIYRIQIEI